MDTAESVYNLTQTLLDFITDHDALTCITVLQLYNLVTQIQNVLTPLLLRRRINAHLEECLADVAAVLTVTERNLRIWNNGRSRRLSIHTLLVPRPTTRELKENREYLILKHASLVAAVQVVAYVKGYNIICPKPSIRPQVENKSVQSLKMKVKVANADQVSLFEVDQFWKCHFGDEAQFAESEDFCDTLSLWMEEPLDDTACKRLLLRLDETNSGYISFATFRQFVRNGNLRETVHLYTSNPPLPLLIWVEDDVSTTSCKALDATQQGVTVIQFASTMAAKQWVTINQSFLKKHDEPGRFRFIADQVLYERNDYHVRSTNEQAGYQLTSYVRDLGIKAPILIYTSKVNIPLTKYVEEYDMVGSMCGNSLILQAYVAALARGRKDDTRWIRYNA